MEATTYFAQAALEQGVGAIVEHVADYREEDREKSRGAAPGPFNLIHAEVPNLMIGTFPFMFIPGFFVPLAVFLPVLGQAVTTKERCLSTDMNIRAIKAGHNVPQEAPMAFADAILTVHRWTNGSY